MHIRKKTLLAVNIGAAFVVLAALVTAATIPNHRPEIESKAGLLEERHEMRDLLAVRGHAGAAVEDSAKWNAPIQEAAAAPGWTSETRYSTFNDWEPAIATDPSAPYVYALTTQRNNPQCGPCPPVHIAMKISSDGGATWGTPGTLCLCSGIGMQWMADPQITTDAAGNVYAAFLANPFLVYFTKSVDHGVTWSTPIVVQGTLTWADHEWIAVSDDGMDVYIGMNQTANYQTSSHDGGDTWSEPVRTTPLTDPKYYFSVGGTVLPDDTVVFADAAYGCCPYGQLAHKKPTDVYAIRSIDGGDTWEQTKLATSAAPPLCLVKKCPKAQYGAQPSLDSDPDGDMLFAYNTATKAQGPQKIQIRTSTDSGVTWTSAKTLTPGGPLIAAFPQVVATGDNAFSVVWADNRKKAATFNVWERETTDGGVTWGPTLRLSNVTTGPGYKTTSGFNFFYGDYGEVDVTSAGKTIAIWSEGKSYAGPGNTWFARET